MLTPDTYNYANGRLRLTRHGDRAGGTVLMLIGHDGAQFSVPDNETRDLVDEVTDMLACGYYPDDLFDELQAAFAPLPSQNVA